MGHVYILQNVHHPGIVKIGFTERDPVQRAREVSSGTGVLGEWRLAWARECIAPRLCEYEVHQALARHRVQRSREFFRCDVATAKKEIERSADSFLRRNYKRQNKSDRAVVNRYFWLAAAVCALLAALSHPSSAWSLTRCGLRVLIAASYLVPHGHGGFLR